MDLGHRVRDLRNARHLSQIELAARAGVARNTLNRIENGHLMPTAPVIEHLAEALNVAPGALFEEPVPLDEALQETGPANVRRLFAEQQTREDWWEAVDNSRRYRSRAKERLREQLSLWGAAINEGSSYEKRREFLDAMGQILDEASGVSRKLLQNLGEGLDRTAEPSVEGTPNPYWTECQEADTLYHELFEMVGKAGLSVRLKKTDQALRQADQSLGQWRHEVLGAA